MKREEAITLTNEYFASLRAAASSALAKRESEVRSKLPEVEELLIKRVQLPLKSLKLAMANKEAASSISERMKNEGLKINADIRAALVKNGFGEDYLSTQYTCAKCKDTGYLPGFPAEMCDCYKRKLSEFMRTGDGVSDFTRQNFSAFDPNRIPTDVLASGYSQREYTIRVKEACEDYADLFPNPIKPNMVLSGPAGTGKTFLLNCIADRVESKGYNVVIITAYRLLEAMRAKHLRTEDGECEFDTLLSCPLLLIDDLGSEPVLRNITREYLGLLINERMLRNLCTVISCNLTPTQIMETYDERIMSRLCDRKQWEFIKLDGKDIRRYDPSRG